MSTVNYEPWTLATILTGGLGTLAIFSFLVRENRLYRIFEHLYIGIAAGLGLVVPIKNYIWPQILVPLLGYDVVQYPDGTFSKVYDPTNLLYILPLSFGCLYYFVYSRRYAWLSKLVIGFSLGMSGGLAFKGFFNEIIPQLASSFKPLVVYHDGALDLFRSFSNTVFVVTLLSVMYYFFFSFRRRARFAEMGAGLGRWLMMVCFGAFFGSTVMARMALLVERLQFLLNDWGAALRYCIGL
ncbi:MAG: hypothetical protein K1X79_03595 [Oligoflexia bacterium]|nr:hypothetical protein [Oligoflexia bacterium]